MCAQMNLSDAQINIREVKAKLLNAHVHIRAISDAQINIREVRAELSNVQGNIQAISVAQTDVGTKPGTTQTNMIENIQESLRKAQDTLEGVQKNQLEWLRSNPQANIEAVQTIFQTALKSLNGG